MRALQLVGDRKLELVEAPGPAAPAEGEVQIRVKAVALNHLDLWGFRGMAFAKRQLPLVVGAAAAGAAAAAGGGRPAIYPGEDGRFCRPSSLTESPPLPRRPRQFVRKRR